MKNEIFQQLAENYIAQFYRMNSDPHREFFKWIAFRSFSSFRNDFENGLITVDEFPRRLKEAFQNTGVMIDTQTTCPAAGICKMASYEPETVMKMFQDLFVEDNGDLELRLKRIRDFIGKSDELLKQYANGSWKYKQGINDVIAYLNLFNPSDNYLYKFKFANKIAQALGYSDAVLSGMNFSLAKYYAMCDEIREAIFNHPGIMAEHDKRKKYTDGVEDNGHIIVYDFMYCALAYDLYNGIEISSPIKRTNGIVKKNKMNAIQEEIDKLQLGIGEDKKSIEALQVELDQLPEIDLIGCTVNHKKYKEGIVLGQKGTKIEIEFTDNGERKVFILPDAVTNGFIILTDSEYTDVLSKRTELIKQIDGYMKSIRYTELLISNLEKER